MQISLIESKEFQRRKEEAQDIYQMHLPNRELPYYQAF